MENKNLITNLIDIAFSYNGDLGVLQNTTINNLTFCEKLLQNKIINYEEYKTIKKAIHDYFEEQIKKVVDNPHYYLL